MIEKIEKVIGYSFYSLFFLVPLVLHPKTSELFEFNKMVLTYVLTVVIVSLWLTRTVLVKKLVIKRTLLDIPILIFLATQFFSTITSVDFRISWLGYYSRYHGGLASSLSYIFLYFAFVSNMDKKKTLNSIIALLASATLVAIYGVLEHLGIDKNIWIQDVQLRVFSTLGQPNWLAAWLVALIPITWALSLKSKFQIPNFKQFSSFKSQISNSFWVWFVLSTLYFLTLIYTRSRSGFVGFATSWIVFWTIISYAKFRLKELNKNFYIKTVILNSTFVFLALTSGTPWTPSIGNYFESRKTVTETQKISQPEDEKEEKPAAPQAPQLEIDPFSSSDIRKIVWTGALDIWKNYPILGTGVETFAISYYNFRPVEHNLVSEWDFLYNKAHNEYLNFMATTGTLGILAYLILILAISFVIAKESGIWNLESKNDDPNSSFLLPASLFAGFASILITNFFGFSVVPVGLQFFLYPAFAVALRQDESSKDQEVKTILPAQKIGIAIILTFALLLLYSISRYWYADLQYSLGTAHNDVGNYNRAREYLTSATKLSPKESAFWEELADVNTNAALNLGQSEDVDQTLLVNVVRSAINESKTAANLSGKNVNTKRKQASMYIKLSVYDPQFLLEGQKVLADALVLAPTEAKLWYNYALTFMRIGQVDKAKEILEKTIEMKPDYRNAHFAYALVLSDMGEKDLAIKELEYILEFITPGDLPTIQQLEEIKGN